MINWFNHLYPYSNFHELNLDWVIATVKRGEQDIADFIGVNTIKYANPILWNIESQYEANTVVVDGQTGNAYISVKAVPSGVHLNREEYWTQIYNYANVVDTLREQISFNEGDTTTASKPFAVGDLVFIKGLLYRVIAPMIAGDSFVVDSNIKKTTIEVELDRLHTADTTLQTNIDNEALARSQADTTLQTNIDNEALARSQADTQLQTSITDLRNRVVNTYKTVNDMVNDGTLASGDYVETLGYHNPGVGGAIYLISSTQATASITLDNGLYANIIVVDEIYLTQLGLVEGGDISALIPIAATLINQRGIIHIDLPSVATASIVLTISGEKELTIDGHEHKIQYTASSGYLFDVTFSGYGYNMNYRNMRIAGNDSNDGIVYHGHGSALNRSEITNCIFNNTHMSITLDNSRQLYIDNISCFNVYRGVSFYSHDAGFCGDTEILNSQFSHLNNEGHSINFSTNSDTSGFGGITIQNNDFYNSQCGIRFFTNGILGDLWILNNQFDGIGNGNSIAIYSESANTQIINVVINDNYATAPLNFLTLYVPNGRVRSAAIINNYINGNSNTNYAMDINCGENGDIEISDNRFTQCSHTTSCVVKISKALLAKFVSNLFSLVGSYTVSYLNISSSVTNAIVTNNISNGNCTGPAYDVQATNNIKDNNLPT